MLINPLSRPLDLVGDKDTNYVQDESHEIIETADRIFVPVHGPFYRDSLIIIDKLTGKKLIENVDYTVLHLLKEVSKSSTKEVYAVIYITKKEISKASLTYRIPGGKYTDLSELYRELIANYANYRKPVYWSEILGLPEEYPVVPHKHQLLDLDQVGELTTALDLVINAIYSQDFENWLGVYEYLDKKLKELDTFKNNLFFNLETRANALMAKSSAFPKEFRFFNNNDDPNVTQPYGTWERRGNYMLYGQMPTEPNKMSTFDIPSGAGLTVKQLALWQFIKHTTLLNYKLTVNKSTIPEGGTVTFTLTVPGGKGGETCRYRITGGLIQNGELVVNTSGVATLNVTVPVDPNTNGTRKIKFTLIDQPHVYKEIDITDVAMGPWFEIGFYKDQYGMISTDAINEGESGYVVIKSKNVFDGTVVNLIYNGSLDNPELDIALPSTVTIYDNIAAIHIKPKLDKITDGEKYLRVGMSVDNLVVPSVATILYVRDISKTPSAHSYWTNTISSNVPIVSSAEGSVVYLTIETTNIPSTTVAGITWSGSAINDDFTTALPSTVKISETGRTVIPLTLKTDNLTEGLEIIEATVKIGSDFVMTTSIFIEDVSRNDNIDVRFSTNSIGTNNLSTVNEGTSIYLVIKTEDIAGEGKLKLVWTGTADSSDFAQTLPEFITIKNNYGYIPLDVKADSVTEGNELLSVAVYDQAYTTLLATQSLTIVDSSTAPTYEILFSSEEGKLVPVNLVTEKDVVYGVIKTTQIPDGTVMFVETLIGNNQATYANGDVLYDVAKTVVIDAGYAYLPIHLRMDERKDGDKDIVIRLRIDSATSQVVTTNKIIVKDTSVVPTYNLSWSSTYDKITPISSAMAGQTIYAHVKTTSIAAGTALYIEYGQAGIGGVNTATDFLQSHSGEILPSITRIDGEGNAIIPINISKTLLGSSALTLRVSLSRNATNATHVVTSTIAISKPTYTLSFAGNQAGTTPITSAKEGQTIYAVLRTTNVPNYTVFDVLVRIGNEDALARNKDVTADVAKQLTIVNNIGSIPIVLTKDTVIEGTEQIDFHILYDHMSKDEEIVYFATQTINLLES